MLSAILITVNNDPVIFFISTSGDNYICCTGDREQTIFKWISKHFTAFWLHEHTSMHIQTCGARLFSLPNRNDGCRGVSESLHSSREPAGARVGAGLWGTLTGHLMEPQSLSNGIPFYETSRSLKQYGSDSEACRNLESSVTYHFTRQAHKFTGSHQVAVSPGHERDPSWKQPVVSVSDRCAQGTWIEVNPSGNWVQTCFNGVKRSCS